MSYKDNTERIYFKFLKRNLCPNELSSDFNEFIYLID